MTRLFNDPATFKDDMVDGFVSAYCRYVEQVPNASGVMRRGGPRDGKVSVIVGGGSGHYPAFCGVVGPGFADGAVIGDIFTSPSAEQAYQVGRALDSGAGVLFSYGNYAGDVMNFGLAEQRLRADGIDCRTVLVTDDIASAPVDTVEKRRGIAGDFSVFKIMGAAAERGDPIDEVERLGRRANDVTRTLGVAFAGCTFPGRTEPLFTVDPTQMELGLGIHGEPGVRTTGRLSASELAAELVDALLEERPPGADGRAAVILNGLGSTKYEELFVVWKDVLPRLDAAGVVVVSPEVGELVTSLDMAGCSLTLTWLDNDLADLWNAPADTPAYRKGQVATPSPLGASADVRHAERVGVSDVPQRPKWERGAASAESVAAGGAVRACLRAMHSVVRENESRLGEIDAVAGDGDHGRGMVRGLRAACEAIQASPIDGGELGAGSALRVAGAAWADNGAGSSGVLWGAFLQAAGDVIGDDAAPDMATVARAVREGAEMIARLGGAKLGDKTLLDALLPFAAAFEGDAAANAPLADAWQRAATTAAEAAERTRDLVPKIGRARPLGEKSLGTPDPGAVSLVLCAQAVGEVLRDECGPARAEGGERA
ncbi:MAG: DAK2 domain-containing protein [Micromonosporaceae bacterium]|nr:DAK2 domain-containing protein [Micromonosporaceae bacterium]